MRIFSMPGILAQRVPKANPARGPWRPALPHLPAAPPAC